MAETNRKQHAYFLSRLGEIQKAAAVRGPSSVILLQTIQELSGWLITHIQGCDAKLRGCIVKTPDSRAAVPR
jgi:hemerythrin